MGVIVCNTTCKRPPCRGVFSAFIWRVWDPSVQLRELRTLFGASAPLNWAHSSVRGLSAIIRRLHSSALRKQNEKMNSRSLHDLSWVIANPNKRCMDVERSVIL